MEAVDVLTPKKIEELRKCFNDNDTDSTGQLEIQLIEQTLKAAGANPTKDEVQDILYDVSGSNTISFNTFCYIYFHLTRGHSVPEDLISSFRALDLSGDGKIKYDLFMKTIDSMARPLSDKEKLNITKHLKQDNGFVDYAEGVKLLTGYWEE